MGINVFEETPADKEQYVVDMLQRGYSYKQIMTDCHVSPATISSIKKKIFGTADNDELIRSSKTTKESQAFRLFQQGKSIIDAKIELDIESNEVVEYYRRYQDLRFLSEFNRAYDSVKGNIAPFLQLFNLMNRLVMTPEQVAEQVRYGNTLPQLQNTHSALSKDIRILESKQLGLSTQVNLMENQVEDYLKSLEYFNNEIEMKKNESSALNYEINTKKKFIQNFDNDEGYVRIKKAAIEQTKSIIQDNRLQLALTLSATLEAIRKYSDNQELIFNLITTPSYSTTSNQQFWMDTHGSRLLQLTEHVQEEIAEQIARMAAGTIQAAQSESENHQ